MSTKSDNIVIVKEDQISADEVEKELGQFLKKAQVKENLSRDTYSRLRRLYEWLERENKN